MKTSLVMIIFLVVVTATAGGDQQRAFVKIGVSKTTIPPMVTTTETTPSTSSSTTTTSASTSSATPLKTTTLGVIKSNSSQVTTTTVSPSISSSTTISTTPLPSTGNTTTTESPQADGKNQTANVTTEVPVKIPRRVRLHQEESYYCKCDLKINVCDVDCCCDIDCTGEMLSLFDCHESYISNEDYHVLHGLPSCRVSSNIFCVLRNNLHRSDYEEFDENLLAEKIHHWPDVLTGEEQSSAAEFQGEIYRLNDPIRIFTATTSEESELKIPLSLSTGSSSVCHAEESVKFLKNIHRSCSKNISSSMEFLTKLSSLEVLPRPKMSCENSGNSCLSFELFHCKAAAAAAYSENCEIFNITTESLSAETLTFDLTLKFVHNFTRLIKVEILIVEKDVEKDDKDSYQQIIDVIFATINESQSHTVSGNIGYLMGEPVIYTHIQSVNISDDKQEPLIDYFHPNRTSRDEDYHMILSESSKGLCFLRNHSREIVNFGENQMRTCEIHLLDALNITQDMNFTEICRNFHKKILSHLYTMPNATQDLSGEEIFVSEFGNPRNDTSNWIQINLIGVEQTSIGGFFDSTDNTLTCRNMLIRVKHEYHFGRLEVAGNRHQALIERAIIDFSPRVDLQFKINEDFRVPIFQYVSFIDLTHRIRNSAPNQNILSALLLPTIIIIISRMFFF